MVAIIIPSLHAFTSRYDSTYVTWLHLFLHRRRFCMRYHHFCKVNNNCYKQQINTSSWEYPTENSNQHTAVEFLTFIKHSYKINVQVHLTHNLFNNLQTQRSIKMKFTPLVSHLNSAQMHFKTAWRNKEVMRL